MRLFGVMGLGLALACGGGGGSPIRVSASPAALAQHLHLPAGLTTVSWAVGPRGRVGLGPTDLELVAWFPRPAGGFVGLDETFPLRAPAGQLQTPAALMEAIGGPKGPQARGALRDGAAFAAPGWAVVGLVEAPNGLLLYAVSQ